MISTICILGDHIQSLGIARIAGRLGLKVILLNEDKICITRFSKFCSNFLSFKTEKQLQDILLDLSDQEKNILLMPTNDKLIEFVINNYGFLCARFMLSTPAPEVLKFCHNKKQTYMQAQKLNIPIPESYFPDSLEQLEELMNRIVFPVILKPAIMYKLYRKTGKKGFLCHNKEELRSTYIKTIKYISASEIIIQKLITGGARNLYSYCSFFANRTTYGSFIAHRIRQKPMDLGISTTFAISTVNESISSYAEAFLKGIHFCGLSEVEFMYDQDDRTYKMLEINPRTWKWHSISNKLGINLIKMMVDYFNDLLLERKENKQEGIGWIETITDSYVAFSEIIKGKLSFSEYFGTLKIEKEFACYDPKDILPAICYVLFLPYLFFSR
ncbi:MAG: hypothetical protein A2Y62_02735 [Candidatus Fischerbacteria bacterium RBG_13_37_8]|uniref:ATP-grasp domain-containing protein n=1 Tax=Candidatus Fischerbacteria bacterium RBG_13_37_8 TaxID=1817863 RepID=A0A1F5VXV2_9BACT|nr:MAG: hypothetical protein A2Y62_02735 [Candidatus Fischerbacteria bacterium RBG_13_37_8]